MLGSTASASGRKKRKVRTDNDGGQACDTDRKRRPDLLFLLRHPETSRITHALNVEIDEHSHEDRDAECELSRPDDIAESINALAQEEFKSRHAAVDWKAEVPITLTLRFNPNAFDGKEGRPSGGKGQSAILLLLLLPPVPARTGRVRPAPPARQVLLLPHEAGREAPLRPAEGARRKEANLSRKRRVLVREIFVLILFILHLVRPAKQSPFTKPASELVSLKEHFVLDS